MPQDWTLDPEVRIIHDDLYARAKECEYERPVLEDDNAAPPNSL